MTYSLTIPPHPLLPSQPTPPLPSQQQGLKGYLLKRMQDSFVMDNPDDFHAVRNDLIQIFDQIGEEYLHKQTIMPIKGGKYLMGGNNITQADVALASIVSPLVLPPGRCDSSSPFSSPNLTANPFLITLLHRIKQW